MKNKTKKPAKIKASELSSAAMTAGNERRFSKVIRDGMLMTWVGIGWVTECKASAKDRLTFPEVTYD